MQHRLALFFAIAFATTWIWDGFAFGVLHLPLLVGLAPGPFLGPTLAAFLVTVLTDGKAGVRSLLGAYVRWRVGPQWYVLALLGMPVLTLLSVLVLPGAPGALQTPSAAFALGYVQLFLTLLVVGGPLGEEPGWRGFALPRLEQRYGPLPGTLILGVLWGLWHLPVYVLVPGYNDAGPGVLGIALPFAQFVVATTATAIIFSWVFHRTRGSLLLAMLLHASVNASGALLQLFQLPPESVSQLLATRTVAFVLAALIVAVATRCRLAYARLQGSSALSL